MAPSSTSTSLPSVQDIPTLPKWSLHYDVSFERAFLLAGAVFHYVRVTQCELPVKHGGVFPVLGLAAAISMIRTSWLLRWQLFPGYASLVLQFIVALELVDPKGNVAVALSIVSCSLYALTALLAYVMPVVVLPVPKGQHGVGTATHNWIDHTRPEWEHGKSSGSRMLVVQIWYPTDTVVDAAASVAPYFQELSIQGPELARSFSMPSFILNHFGLTSGHARKGVPAAAASAPFPVLVFSHGYSGFVAQNTILCEALASHGYVVVSVNHTYDAQVTVFEDGTVAGFKAAPPPRATLPDLWRLRAHHLEIRASDVSYVIDQVAALNSGARDSRGIPGGLQGRLDLSRIGVFGHSFGGGTSMKASLFDPRIGACVGLDAWLFPLTDAERRATGRVPTLLLQQEAWPQTESFLRSNDSDAAAATRAALGLPYDAPSRMFDQDCEDAHSRALAAVSRSPASQLLSRYVRVDGTKHFDFADLSVYAPSVTRLLGLTGRMPGHRIQQLMIDYAIAFFDAALGVEAARSSKASTPFGAIDALYPEAKVVVGASA